MEQDIRSFTMSAGQIIVSAERLAKFRDEISYLRDRAKYYGEIPKTLEKFTALTEKLTTELTDIIRGAEGT